MDVNRIMDTFRDGIALAIRIGAPILILCMLVGVVVAILQAATQIHEQSIAFILKVIVVIAVLSLGGSWMLESLRDYAYHLFDMML